MLKNFVSLTRKLARTSLFVIILHYVLEYLSSHNEFTFSILNAEHTAIFTVWMIGIIITHFAFSMIWMSLTDEAHESDITTIL